MSYLSRFESYWDSNVDASDLSVIIEGKLFLSGRGPPHKIDLMHEKGITHILSITRMDVRTKSDALTYKWIDLDDMSHENLLQHFDDAHSFIESAWASSGACLVHCDAGVSRSSTIVISFIMRHKQLPLRDAFVLVKTARSIISPNFGFIKQLCEYERLRFPHVDPYVFRVYFFRNHFSIKGDTFTDEQITNALRENDNDVYKALQKLENAEPGVFNVSFRL